MKTLSILKPIADDDEPYAQELTEKIWEQIVDESGAETKERLDKAIGLVAFDGYYGPGHHEDDEDLSFKDALKFVRNALKTSVDDIEYFDDRYSFEVDKEDCALPNAVISGRDIVRSIFKFYHEIYGSWG